ncbi:MAG: hypothetical protein NVV74_04185 [Magnetospirillum sp.]|nr:hypothetical protein [Magnetospirillum sp.]
MGHAQDAVHGGADFVADHRQEFRFGAVGRLGLVARARQLLLEGDTVGNVSGAADDADHAALGVAEGGLVHQGADGPAGGMTHRGFVDVGTPLAGDELAVGMAALAGQLVVAADAGQSAADDAVARQAGHLDEGAVAPQVAAAGVAVEDGVGNGVDDRLVQRQLILQRRLGRLARGDVVARHQHGGAVLLERDHGNQRPERPSVGGAQAHLHVVDEAPLGQPPHQPDAVTRRHRTGGQPAAHQGLHRQAHQPPGPPVGVQHLAVVAVQHRQREGGRRQNARQPTFRPRQPLLRLAAFPLAAHPKEGEAAQQQRQRPAQDAQQRDGGGAGLLPAALGQRRQLPAAAGQHDVQHHRVALEHAGTAVEHRPLLAQAVAAADGQVQAEVGVGHPGGVQQAVQDDGNGHQPPGRAAAGLAVAGQEDGHAADDADAALDQFGRPGQHRLAGLEHARHRRPLVLELAQVAADGGGVALHRIDIGDGGAAHQRDVADMVLLPHDLAGDGVELGLGDVLVDRDDGGQAAGQQQAAVQLAFQSRAQGGQVVEGSQPHRLGVARPFQPLHQGKGGKCQSRDHDGDGPGPVRRHAPIL